MDEAKVLLLIITKTKDALRSVAFRFLLNYRERASAPLLSPASSRLVRDESFLEVCQAFESLEKPAVSMPTALKQSRGIFNERPEAQPIHEFHRKTAMLFHLQVEEGHLHFHFRQITLVQGLPPLPSFAIQKPVNQDAICKLANAGMVSELFDNCTDSA